jgi:hypothetical protein
VIKWLCAATRKALKLLEISMDNDTIISYGFHHGQDLFQYNWTDVKITEDMEYEEYIEAIAQLAWEADENYRSYSPFEFFAKGLNEMEDPDAAWDLYETAINDGIEDQLKTLTEEDFNAAKQELFGDVE